MTIGRLNSPPDFNSCNKAFGLDFLFIIGVQDYGTVLLTEVVALPVERGWIMDMEKDVKKIGIADDGWVIFNFIHFRMACCPTADLLIGWFVNVAPRVARRHLEDTFQPGKDGLGAPETAAAQNRRFDSISHVHRA